MVSKRNVFFLETSCVFFWNEVLFWQYGAADGRGEWLKRIGQFDSLEEVVGMEVTSRPTLLKSTLQNSTLRKSTPQNWIWWRFETIQIVWRLGFWVPILWCPFSLRRKIKLFHRAISNIGHLQQHRQLLLSSKCERRSQEPCSLVRALNPKPQLESLMPKLSILNPKPSTPNPKSKTPKPKPSTISLWTRCGPCRVGGTP